MKSLVLGGTNSLGKLISEELVKRQHETITLIRAKTDWESNLPIFNVMFEIKLD